MHDSYPPSHEHQDCALKPSQGEAGSHTVPTPYVYIHTYIHHTYPCLHMPTHVQDGVVEACCQGTETRRLGEELYTHGTGGGVSVECGACAQRYGECNGDGWKALRQLRCSSPPHNPPLWVGVIDSDWGLGFVLPGCSSLLKAMETLAEEGRDFLEPVPECREEGNARPSPGDLNLMQLSVFLRRLELLEDVGFASKHCTGQPHPSSSSSPSVSDRRGNVNGSASGVQTLTSESKEADRKTKAQEIHLAPSKKQLSKIQETYKELVNDDEWDGPLVGVLIASLDCAMGSAVQLKVGLRGLVVGAEYGVLVEKKDVYDSQTTCGWVGIKAVSNHQFVPVSCDFPQTTDTARYSLQVWVYDASNPDDERLADENALLDYRSFQEIKTLSFCDIGSQNWDGKDGLSLAMDYHTQAKPVCKAELTMLTLTEESLQERKKLYDAEPLSPHNRCGSSLVCQLARENDEVAAQGNVAGCMANLSNLEGTAHLLADTLIIYAFAATESGSGVWEDNLDFFLAQGLIADARYRFVVVCNGEVDEAWREKLDRVADWLPNFEWHQRADEGRDVGAWRAVLNGEVRVGVDVKLIQRFILMNSSIRGPFVPEYYSEGWPEAVLGLLHSRRCPDCQLAGLLVDCNCEIPSRCPDTQQLDNHRAALDEAMLAFESDLLPLVSSLLKEVL